MDALPLIPLCGTQPRSAGFCHPWLKSKKPTSVRQWVDKFCERIKTRLPRHVTVARSQTSLESNCGSRQKISK
jgi:hypothetical protein